MTHPAPNTEPDVAGARERVSLWANYEFTCEDTVAVSSPLVTFTAGDLRLILSAYDRQGEGLRLVHQMLSTTLFNLNQPGGRETNIDRLIMTLEQIETAAARARQGGPDHG